VPGRFRGPETNAYCHPSRPHAAMGLCGVCYGAIKAMSTLGHDASTSGRRLHRQKQKSARKLRLQKYGLTDEDYRHMLEKQGGVCAICHRKNGSNNRRLHVDHDHKTEKVRGLLCGTCNTGIGLLRDKLSMLYKAIAYLEDAM
jgi:hypothetical protein